MSKKIEWLENFAEKFKQDLQKEDNSENPTTIIIDKEDVGESKVGDLIKFKGKLYKVANLEYEDEVGPGVIIVPIEDNRLDPMSMAMGINATGLSSDCVVEPERARVNPGDVYDLGDIREEEVTDADIAAVETEIDIQEDNSIDRTTVPGHFETTETPEVVETEEDLELVVTETPEVEELTEVELEEENTLEEVAELIEDEVDSDMHVVECEIDDPMVEETEVVAKKINRISKRIMSFKK